MRQTLTAEQLSYFTKNGHIEIEGIAFDPSLFPPAKTYETGRDHWRNHPSLKTFLLRKIGPLALDLTAKNQLRLACDQWIPTDHPMGKPAPAKDFFSIQNLALGAIIAPSASPIPKRSPLGILPLPSTPSTILFFKPTLILDWPKLSSPIYLVLFALHNAVYVHNPKDPLTNAMKAFNYGFGDLLKNETHPLIIKE